MLDDFPKNTFFADDSDYRGFDQTTEWLMVWPTERLKSWFTAQGTSHSANTQGDSMPDARPRDYSPYDVSDMSAYGLKWATEGTEEQPLPASREPTQTTLGDLIKFLERSKHRHLEYMAAAAKDGPIAGKHTAIQESAFVEADRLQLKQLDGFNELRATFNAVGDEVSLISMRSLHGRLCLQLGKGPDAVDSMNLREVLGALHLNPIDPRQGRHTLQNRVFVVHGHDDAMKEAVARLLEKLKLEAVILHEKANQGKTLIEKFEANADVGFAVILLSPDDECRVSGASRSRFRKRARQNVVFELGFFIGKLSRDRVMVLRKHHADFEDPSDTAGIVYHTYDDPGNWKLELVRELTAAGYKVDANSLLPPITS